MNHAFVASSRGLFGQGAKAEAILPPHVGYKHMAESPAPAAGAPALRGKLPAVMAMSMSKRINLQICRS
jgi:hypothetical protein